MDSAEAIKLKIGGSLFETTKCTLLESPYFEGFFSEVMGSKPDEDGIYHVDADGDQFQHVLSYLRHCTFPLFWSKETGFDFAAYARLAIQADFFQVLRLKDWIDKQKYKSVITQTKETTVRQVEQPGQGTRLMGDSGARVVSAQMSIRKRYVCPRGIISHYDNKDGCGRQCRNAWGDDGPDYEDVPILIALMETEEITFKLEKLADDGE